MFVHLGKKFFDVKSFILSLSEYTPLHIEVYSIYFFHFIYYWKIIFSCIWQVLTRGLVMIEFSSEWARALLTFVCQSFAIFLSLHFSVVFLLLLWGKTQNISKRNWISLLRYGATTNKNFGANLGKITNFNHPSIEREFYLYLASKLDNYECCTIYLHTFIHTWLGQKKFSCVKQRIENIWKIKLGSCTLQ